MTKQNMMYSLLVAAATLCYAISVNGIKAYLGHINSLTATVWSFLPLIGPLAAIYLFGFTDVIEHATTSRRNEVFGFVSILAIAGFCIIGCCI